MANACVDSTIQVGNVVRATGAFTNALDDFNPIDPSLVYCTVFEPDGTETTYQWGTDPQVQKTSIGVYFIEQLVNAAGTWFFKWHSDGNVICASEDSLRVLSTQ